MPFELHVTIGKKEHKIFLQDGFFDHKVPASCIHKHNYAEVHLMTGGKGVFRIGEQLQPVPDGGMLVIPGNIMHCCHSMEKKARHTAFQLDFDFAEAACYTLHAGLAAAFFEEIDRCLASGDYTGVAGYITLFCRYFSSGTQLHVQPVTDYGFLIHEFFANHYSEELQLRDLAEELHLSQRQAERLVIECCGRTFRDELAHTRVEMARFMLQSTPLSRTEAALYVGYRSYAGFWKALKKFT